MNFHVESLGDAKQYSNLKINDYYARERKKRNCKFFKLHFLLYFANKQ